VGDVGATTDSPALMGEVIMGWHDPSPDPDTVHQASNLSFVGFLTDYGDLNILGAAHASYAIQCAGAFTDLHTDPEDSIAFQMSGEKLWVAFPPTPRNTDIFLKMHSNSEDYSCLARKALENMEGGRCCISRTEDLVYVETGWFHLVLTKKPSILITSWLVLNGYKILLTLRSSMDAMRARYKGRNDELSLGWTDGEKQRFELGLDTLYKDIEKSMPTDLVIKFTDIWGFRKFNNPTDPEEVEWFLNTLFSEAWKKLAKKLKNKEGGNPIWANGCFDPDCKGRKGPVSITSIMRHMKKSHRV
jgi:hypothetical protein